MPAPIAGQKKKTQNLSGYGRIYTDDEIRRSCFPIRYVGKQYVFVSQKPNLEIAMPPFRCALPFGMPVDSGNGKVVIRDTFEFGCYRIKFNGNQYVTQNLIEYRMLMSMNKIVCLGEYVPPKPAEKPVLVASKKQAKDIPDL